MQETRVQSLGPEIPWRRKWQPNPVLLPRKSHGWRSLVYIHGVTKSQKQLSDLTFPPPPMCGHPFLLAWGLTPYSRLPLHVDTLLTNHDSEFPHQSAHHEDVCMTPPGLWRTVLCSDFDFPHATVYHLDTFFTPASDTSCQAPLLIMWMAYSPCLGVNILCQAFPVLCPPPLWIPSLSCWILTPALGYCSFIPPSQIPTLFFLSYNFMAEIFMKERHQIGCLKCEDTEIQKFMWLVPGHRSNWDKVSTNPGLPECELCERGDPASSVHCFVSSIESEVSMNTMNEWMNEWIIPLYSSFPFLLCHLSICVHRLMTLYVSIGPCECEVKWALESITTNKASGCDGIPVELFQILKDDAVKVLQTYASKFGKLSSGHRTGKGQFSFQSQRRAIPKNAQTTAQLHSSHTLAK